MAGSDFSSSFITGFGSAPSRCGPERPPPPVNEETSRFPCKERPYMPGSQTTRSRSHARARAHDHLAFRWSDGVGAPIEAFAAQWLAYTFPCRRFASGLAAGPRTARGRCGSLLLHRSGLAPPTPCRSPGAPDPNFDLRASSGINVRSVSDIGPTTRCSRAAQYHRSGNATERAGKIPLTMSQNRLLLIPPPLNGGPENHYPIRASSKFMSSDSNRRYPFPRAQRLNRTLLNSANPMPYRDMNGLHLPLY
jgi:hypothetical protein